MYKKILFLLVLILVLPNFAVAQVSYNISVSAMVLSNSINPAPPENQNSGVILTDLPTILLLEGFTSPSSMIKISVNETSLIETISDENGKFNVSVNNLVPGSYNLTIVSIDSGNFSTRTFSLQIVLLAKKITNIINIFLSPTVAIIGNNDGYILTGSIAPYSKVNILYQGLPVEDLSTKSDALGNYSFVIDENFKKFSGEYINLSSFHGINGLTSDISLPVFISSNFFDISKDISSDIKTGTCLSYADLNYDCLANIIDFNILHYWFRKNMSPQTIDLNKDGVIDMSDFSILAHYWN